MEFENTAIDNLQKQYLYTNVAKLCIEKAKVYDKNVGIPIASFGKEILNINTCSSSALDNFWGKIFRISRTFRNEETNEIFTLTDEEFREILLLRAFATNWDGALASLNVFIINLFKERGKAYVIDNLNMTTLIFSFDFALKDWEIYLFTKTNILPRPAGVGAEISIIDDDRLFFGFSQYYQIVVSPITIGFGEYEKDPMGKGLFLDYNNNL